MADNRIGTAAAGTGIGSSTARRALAEGADVVVSDYHERRLGETRDELAGLGLGRVAAVVCDVTSTEAVDALIARTVEQMGRLDVLVNNAGLGGQTPVADMTDEEWEKRKADEEAEFNARFKDICEEMIAAGIELPDRLLRRRTFASIKSISEALAEVGVKEESA